MGIYLNTNLASLNLQHTFTDTTDKLALAIERMTTGFRINCAADDAAGYSIANRMSTDLSSFQVASENAQMGSAMLSTAEGGLNIITNHLERIRDLAIQASNETYGTDARNAMQSEADARLEETQRILSTTEYNDKNIFAGEAGVIRTGKFIDDAVTYSAAEVAEMTKLGTVSTSTTISTGKYSISTADELEQLATMVNNGKVTGGEFVLAADIDLGHIDNWTPIEFNYRFNGTFDGNGHVVKNMKINSIDQNTNAGLFGSVYNATIKNVGVVDCDIKSGTGEYYYVGGLVGFVQYGSCTIENCYTTGNIFAANGPSTGGLIGAIDINASTNISNCYSDCDVISNNNYNYNYTGVGGLIGSVGAVNVTNCFATGEVLGNIGVGGLVGIADGTVLDNCFAAGEVSGYNHAGGLIGSIGSISNTSATLSNCYATSKVNKGDLTINSTSTSSSFSTITVSTTKTTVTTDSTAQTGYTGTDDYSICIDNMYTGVACFGALIGHASTPLNISDCAYNDAINPTLVGMVADYNDPNGLTNRTDPQSVLSLDLTPKLAPSEAGKGVVTLQVGISADENSKLTFDTAFNLGSIALDLSSAQNARAAVQQIDELLSTVSQKKTVFGAAQNRLSSVLDALNVSIQNTTSALSTIRDADIATVSSSYIKNQILQQAASALLTSANQSPSIALQLI